MDLHLDIKNTKNVQKQEIEQVQKQKQEYKFIGKYLRTPGLRLYAYNSLKDKLIEIQVKSKRTVTLATDEIGNLLTTNRSAKEECTVDSRNIHFEALNIKTATKRVNKYKNGKIKELCNLSLAKNKKINLW